MPCDQLQLERRPRVLTPAENLRRRPAITLVELLLVMFLLVVVGSLAAPLFEGSFSTIRLRRGSDQVLAAWSQARTYAIEIGETYQFRIEPSGSKYRVERWSGGIENQTVTATGEIVTENATGSGTSNDALESEAETELLTWTLEETLPEEITFSTAEAVNADQLGQRQTTRLDQQTLDSWSAPVLFFPDGTTSEASLLLKNEKSLYQRVTLRSLTGTGRASELLSREEITRLGTQ